MPDVFLSYKREDLKPATRLIEALRRAGLDVWWDFDIPPDAPWEATIERALDEARVVLVCWSRAAVASDNVRSEARWARERGRLIQAFVEPCSPPLFFGERQGVDLSGWSGEPAEARFMRLISAIKVRLAGTVFDPRPPSRSPEDTAPPGGWAKGRRRDIRRWATTGVIAACVCLLAAITWLTHGLWFNPAPAATRIAVAPITTQGEAPWLANFAASLSDQVLGVLSTRQIPTVSGAEAARLGSPGGEGEARRLGVRLLIDGTARSDETRAAVDLHLEDPASRATVWSVTFEGEPAKADELRAQIAAKVAAMLDCGSRALRPVGGLKDPDALSSYLKACDLFQTSGGQFDPDPTFQLFAALRRVIAAAPDFAPAHSDLAKYEAYFTHYGVFSADQAVALRKEARAEAARALALDPKNADAYVALAFLVPRPGWAERERLLRKALSADPDWPHANGFLGILLGEVGRLQEAAAYTQRASAANPLNPDLGWSAQSADALSAAGRNDDADRVVAQLVRLWPADQDVWNARLSVAENAGRWDQASALMRDPARPRFYQSSDVADFELLFRAAKSRSPAQVAASRRVEIKKAKKTPALINPSIIGLSILGDVDDAFDLASSPAAKAFADGPYATLFLPPTLPMRRDPRFMALAARLGLVDYWTRTGKWPDFCSEPGLRYDCKAEAAKLTVHPVG